MRITYKDFEAYLKKNGYSKDEIIHLFNVIKAMDDESRNWVIRWFVKGILPSDKIENVTASFLIDKCGYKPINAFIILDWLKTDPQAAKYFLLKIPSTISPSEAIGEEILKLDGPAENKSLDDYVDENDFIS